MLFIVMKFIHEGLIYAVFDSKEGLQKRKKYMTFCNKTFSRVNSFIIEITLK